MMQPSMPMHSGVVTSATEISLCTVQPAIKSHPQTALESVMSNATDMQPRPRLIAGDHNVDDDVFADILLLSDFALSHNKHTPQFAPATFYHVPLTSKVM